MQVVGERWWRDEAIEGRMAGVPAAVPRAELQQHVRRASAHVDPGHPAPAQAGAEGTRRAMLYLTFTHPAVAEPGNPASIRPCFAGGVTLARYMESLGPSFWSGKSVVDGLVDCMGVSSISAEMLLANYFSTGILSTYCRERINKSDKGGAAIAARVVGTGVSAEWRR